MVDSTKRKSPRRKRNMWSQKETELLLDSVEKYGKSWALIEKNVSYFKNNGRTQIDLKDKYRNILYKALKDELKIKVQIYSKKTCSYCQKAKELLNENNIKFEEIEINDKNKDKIYKEIDFKTNDYRSVPIIFINDKFIGGYTELKKYKL